MKDLDSNRMIFSSLSVNSYYRNSTDQTIGSRTFRILENEDTVLIRLKKEIGELNSIDTNCQTLSEQIKTIGQNIQKIEKDTSSETLLNRKEREKTLQTIANLKTKIGAFKRKMTQLDRQFEILSKSNFDLQQKYFNSKNKIDLSKQEIDSMQEKLKSIKTENSNLSELKIRIKEKNVQLNGKVAEMSKFTEMKLQEVVCKKEANEEAKHKLDLYLKSLEGLSLEHIRLSTLNQSTLESIQNVEINIDCMNSMLHKLERQVEIDNSTNLEMRKQIFTFENKLEKKRKQVECNQLKIESIEERIANENDLARKIEEDLNELNFQRSEKMNDAQLAEEEENKMFSKRAELEQMGRDLMLKLSSYVSLDRNLQNVLINGSSMSK